MLFGFKILFVALLKIYDMSEIHLTLNGWSGADNQPSLAGNNAERNRHSS